MGLRASLEAKAKREEPIEPLLAVGGGNAAAYELLEQLPPYGVARVAAWCAFVLQTYADKVLTTGNDDGCASAGAAAQARTLYGLVRAWLERADHAAADPAYRLEPGIPQSLPRPDNVPPERDQIAGMRATLEALQARAGVELTRAERPVASRLQPSLEGLQAALDAAPVRGGRGAEGRLAVARTLEDGLERGYVLGQLLAVPSLVCAEVPPPSPPVIATSGPAVLGVFLPGDPAFDPWCLTDPAELPRLRASTGSRSKLDAFWKSDPDPVVTLRLQREIVRELQAGTLVAVLSDAGGPLRRFTAECPWPGTQFVSYEMTIGGIELVKGDRFVLAAGDTGAGFERKIVRLAALEGR